MKIGGLFPPEELPPEDNGYLAALTGDPARVRHFMSGRCGILCALEDILYHDTIKTAYLPAYTCETVSGCFVKMGCNILYYDVGRDLVPRFDPSVLGSISILLLCGYYGFLTYDTAFVRQCAQAGVHVLQDMTHTAFSDNGVCPDAQYAAGSMRKWYPVACGGLAFCKSGNMRVPVALPDTHHLRLRQSWLAVRDRFFTQNDPALEQQAGDLFWEGEMLLRSMYGDQGSDAASVEVVRRYPIAHMRQRRRDNFLALLQGFHASPALTPVFHTLPDGVCPLHFPVYSQNRDAVQEALKQLGIASTVYWPVPPFIEIQKYPGAAYVYKHILSIPCDQRYTPADMEFICRASAMLAGQSPEISANTAGG